MTFKEYVREILKKEISNEIKQGYFLETEFCTMICEKYNLSIHTVRGTLRGIYPEMSLIKRRMSDELKRFHGCLEIKGCPIMYIPENKPNGNC